MREQMGRLARYFWYISKPLQHTEGAQGWLALLNQLPLLSVLGALVVTALAYVFGTGWIATLAYALAVLAALALLGGHRLFVERERDRLIGVNPIIQSFEDEAYLMVRIEVRHLPAARGQLVSVLPASKSAVHAADIAVRNALQGWEFPPGLLQWSSRYGASRYGGGEVTDIAGEADLDVVALTPNSSFGRFIYLNADLRDRFKLPLIDDVAWQITVRVSGGSGQQRSCSFKISAGKTEIWKHARPGPRYLPELSDVSCS